MIPSSATRFSSSVPSHGGQDRLNLLLTVLGGLEGQASCLVHRRLLISNSNYFSVEESWKVEESSYSPFAHSSQKKMLTKSWQMLLQWLNPIYLTLGGYYGDGAHYKWEQICSSLTLKGSVTAWLAFFVREEPFPAALRSLQSEHCLHSPRCSQGPALCPVQGRSPLPCCTPVS